MITTTMQNAIKAYEVIQKFLHNSSMNISLAYKIAKMAQLLEPENKAYEDSKQRLIERYGERDANGKYILLDNGSIKITPAFIQDCQNELSQFMNQSLELNLEPFTLDELSVLPNITPSILIILNDFIV